MSFTNQTNASWFALVDCNNFYVSCERLFNPKLENKPTIILSSNDGCVIARSNEAKALGIAMSAPLFLIQSIVKAYHVQVLSSNFALYGDISRRIMQTLYRFSPEVEIYSIDEAFLRLKPDEFNTLATLRSTLLKEIGIPVSIGLAPTKTLAKAATSIAKKKDSGTHTLTQEMITKTLETLAVEDVWGIGTQLTLALHREGIWSALDLTTKPDSWIKARFSVTLLRTVWELRGLSTLSAEAGPTSKKSIVVSRTFGHPIEDLQELLQAVLHFTTEATKKLRKQKSKTHFLQLYLEPTRASNLPLFSISIPLERGTNYLPSLTEQIEKALCQIYKKGIPFRKAGVMLSHFTPDDVEALSLWSPPGKDSQQQKQVMKVMDQIQARFGVNSIQFAATLGEKSWAPLSSLKSSQFTTNWSELLTIHLDSKGSF